MDVDFVIYLIGCFIIIIILGKLFKIFEVYFFDILMSINKDYIK